MLPLVYPATQKRGIKAKIDYQAEKRRLVCSPVWPLQRWNEAGRKFKSAQKQLKKQSYNNESNSYGVSSEQGKSEEIDEYDESMNDTQSTDLELCSFSDINSDESISIFCGLEVHQNGIVKQNQSLNHVFFGFSKDYISKVELMIPFGLINIHRSLSDIAISKFNKFQFKTKEYITSALDILNSRSNDCNQQLIQLIEQCSVLFTSHQQLLGPTPRLYLSCHKESKDNEFYEFINFSFEYLKSLPKCTMHTYNIGRMNPINDQVEIIHFGYSQAYLDLIGIDSGVLASLMLRKKKIELLLNALDVNRLTANAMAWMKNCNHGKMFNEAEFQEQKNYKNLQELLTEPVSSQIATFDGFKLNLTQRMKVLYLPFNYLCVNEKMEDCSFGYMLQIFELDVDLGDLEQLIAYRQRLQSQTNTLSLQDYLRKELSLMFEDVEYSVRSQEFLEKYYENVLSLEKMQQEKQEIMRQDASRCRYREIKK